jgi:hypothetical protein
LRDGSRLRARRVSSLLRVSDLVWSEARDGRLRKRRVGA